MEAIQKNQDRSEIQEISEEKGNRDMRALLDNLKFDAHIPCEGTSIMHTYIPDSLITEPLVSFHCPSNEELSRFKSLLNGEKVYSQLSFTYEGNGHTSWFAHAYSVHNQN